MKYTAAYTCMQDILRLLPVCSFSATCCQTNAESRALVGNERRSPHISPQCCTSLPSDTTDTSDTNDTNLIEDTLGPRCPRCLLCSCREWIGWWQRRRAIGAARSHKWNAAQAIRAIARGRRHLHFLWLVAGHQCVHRLHNKEVYNESHNQETDQSVNESAGFELYVAKFNGPG